MPNSRHKHRQAGRRAALFLRWLVAGAFLAALGYAVYLLINSRRVEVAEQRDKPVRPTLNAEQRRLSDNIGEQEKKYESAAATGRTDAETVRMLESAIQLQRELLRVSPRAGLEQSVRLGRLEAARDNERAKLAAGRIEALEAQAAKEQQAGHAEAATEKLREALESQRGVNNGGAETRQKNFPRETRLAQALESAETAPLHEKVVSAMTQAAAAKREQRWADALAAFGRARDAQALLNQNHARTQFADLPGLEAIEAEIAALSAAGTAAEIEAREKKGDAAAEAGRVQEAAGLFLEAYDLQGEFNGKFPRSRFVSTQRLAELEAKRQTALSSDMMAAVLALDRAATASLLKRQVLAAVQKIASAAELLTRVEKEFPKSRVFEGPLKIKLAYLSLRQADIRQLQDQVYERLVPVPESANVLMLKTEVPQDIYAKVMSGNPSRNPGRALPVDSVNWQDAQEFCQRLSWLLGTRARLPTEREFRAAFGDGELAAWSTEMSGGRSHETGALAANAAGFCDLAGNLAEWIQSAAENKSAAAVAGGSFLDAQAVLKTLPVVPVKKAERARQIGFRVVVELALD